MRFFTVQELIRSVAQTQTNDFRGIYRIADPDKVWADLADFSIKEYQALL